MSIKNFGLQWNRDAVHWYGNKGDAGRLMGEGPIGYAKKNQTQTDFREQIGIYVLYSDGKAIYVGQAGSGNNTLFSRLKQHLTDHLADRWDKFSWFGVRKVNKDGSISKAQGDLNRNLKATEILDLIEGLMINVIEPPLNKQGARWKNIDQYYQFEEGWSSWSNKELLVTIAETLDINPEDY